MSIFKLSIIFVAIRWIEQAFSVHFSILHLAQVNRSIGPFELSETWALISMERAFVRITISEPYRPISLPQPFDKLSSINSAIFHSLNPISLILILPKMSFINLPCLFNHLALPSHNSIRKLTCKHISIRIIKPPPSIGDVLLPHAGIPRAIFELFDTKPMPLLRHRLDWAIVIKCLDTDDLPSVNRTVLVNYKVFVK